LALLREGIHGHLLMAVSASIQSYLCPRPARHAWSSSSPDYEEVAVAACPFPNAEALRTHWLRCRDDAQLYDFEGFPEYFQRLGRRVLCDTTGKALRTL
jgi:hypothetical protein